MISFRPQNSKVPDWLRSDVEHKADDELFSNENILNKPRTPEDLFFAFTTTAGFYL